MFLGRCLVCLSFRSVYRCQARYGSGQGSVTDILNHRRWMMKKRRQIVGTVADGRALIKVGFP